MLGIGDLADPRYVRAAFLPIQGRFDRPINRIGRSRRAPAPYHGGKVVAPPGLRAAPRLRRPRVRAATGPPHTSGPRARSATYPTHEDSDPGPPAPHTGSTRRRSDPGTEPAR